MAERTWRDDSRLPLALHGLALLIGGALLLAWIGSTPGLDGDEAWAGLRAHAIAAGARPLVGMNGYTGPFHGYLLVPFCLALGWNVVALRLPSALASIAALHLHFLAVRRTFDAWTAAIASLALATFPFFVLEGRLGIEITALGPLLAIGSIWLLLRGGAAGSFAAGALLAIGTWSHLLFAPVPLAIGIAWLQGRAPERRPVSPVARRAAAGFAAALLPRLILLLVDHGHEDWGSRAQPSLNGLLFRLAQWPAAAFRYLHGDLLFLRFTGEVRVPTPPIAALLAVAGLIWLTVRAAPQARRRERALLAGIVTLFAGTMLIAPSTTHRYFLLPLLAAPLLIALLLRAAMAQPRGGVLLMACGALAVLQTARVAVNFLGEFQRSGGTETAFSVGSWPDGSNHFVRTDLLYRALCDRGVRQVVTEYHVGEPLRFEDLGAGRLGIHLVEEIPIGGPSLTLGADDRFVIYAGGLRRLGPEDAPGLHVVEREDDRFLILGP